MAWSSAYIARRRGTEVDPIEANALHGGRMSMRGSLIVAAQTVWSSGIGASVGLEAGYTQLASGIASKIGQAFRLRRSDMRILVGCGAAAAIAGAFGAPLGGAFYGFELIIGSYSIASLAPVGMAALVGYLTAQAFAPDRLGIETGAVSSLAVHDVVIAGGVGLLAAIFGIALMRGVAACEMLFTRLRVKPALRPMLGGALVGLLAMISPQVMSSGHGALHLTGIFKLPLATIALIFVLKALASIVSLGSGFRGGLFFASLLLGALGGQLFAVGLDAVWPGLHANPDAYAIIGMGALSVSVIGGPLTMTFIALETTGDLWLTTAVLIAVIISMQVTREFFGYSFTTWRFHLRGETIRSAADVGWIRDLTVGADDARGRAHGAGGDADLGVPRGVPARLDQPGGRGRRGRPLRRHGAGGGGACGRTRRHRVGARHPAPRRPHAAAADDGAGSDRGLRPLRSGSAGGGRLGGAPAGRSGCSARRMRCAAIRTRPSGSGANCSANCKCCSVAAVPEFVTCSAARLQMLEARFIIGNRPAERAASAAASSSMRSRSPRMLSSALVQSRLICIVGCHFVLYVHCRHPMGSVAVMGKAMAAAMVPELADVQRLSINGT